MSRFRVERGVDASKLTLARLLLYSLCRPWWAAESGEEDMPKVLGIDLGTTNSCMAVMEGGEATVIPN